MINYKNEVRPISFGTLESFFLIIDIVSSLGFRASNLPTIERYFSTIGLSSDRLRPVRS
jgi:hypothetical protein